MGWATANQSREKPLFVASGEKTQSEPPRDHREIAIFKDGVTL